ncbi:DUF262 domain-containing protein [Epilithonimonas mollis]|uniref:Intein N-terminal splicing region n=1 Tax=Epilithonimonas mollis TaxID=216903 RepID=A0A1M6MZH1_9FLAO|nr:DUF262 domain-containing protein [Epilithonimonas mollis]SHJ88804.1 intein N-terminal splicing region [Epilithonimonas mollis]
MTTSFWNLISRYKIVIPLIQRDYAQGRKSEKITAIRTKFLNSIKSALQDENGNLELDFIYGYVKTYSKESVDVEHFIPLDGQQRLTTLFLLHYILAVKEGRLEELKPLFRQFSYETRHSSNVFCEKLVEFDPGKHFSNIAKNITDQPWFFTSWNNDPTIFSILTVLDALECIFKDSQISIDTLIGHNSRIVFHLLPMDKLGLPDDLYIKMNSRGKELNTFEYFKSQFSEIIPTTFVGKFKNDVDQKWSDLFWDMHKNLEGSDLALLSDKAFLRFYYYISDILCLKNNVEKSNVVDKLLYDDLYNNSENVSFLFKSFDVLCDKPVVFESLFYVDELDYHDSKVRIFFDKPDVNLFYKCSTLYSPDERVNPFSLGEQILLFAYLIHLINDTEDFSARLRMLRNLVANSEDTVRFDNLSLLLSDTELLITTGNINQESKFNTRQIIEEKLKQQIIENHFENRDEIYKTEDHKLLRGSLALFDFDNNFNQYTTNFRNLFSDVVDYKLMSYALLATIDYTQLYNWRWRLGTRNDSSWRELFTPSNSRKFFEKTQKSVYSLIENLLADNSKSIESIVNDYKVNFQNNPDYPKDWIYYYINYDMFEINQDGFLYWPVSDEDLNYYVMKKTSLGGSHWSPFLYALSSKYNTKVSLGIYGDSLVLTKKNISVKLRANNQGFYIEEKVTKKTHEYLEKLINDGKLTENYEILINRNVDGLDIEDRVVVGGNFIEEFFKGI